MYQIKKCSAPCVKKIEEKKYLELSNKTILFLKGKNKKIQSSLNFEMKNYSSKKLYEKAGDLRDRINTKLFRDKILKISSINVEKLDKINF